MHPVSLMLLAVLSASPEPQPMLAVKGEQIFSDDFSAAEITPAWRITQGDWKVVDGVLKGGELAKDNHPAAIMHMMKFTDVIIQCDFRFDGATQFNVSINNARGHVCRAVVYPDRFVVSRDADRDKPGDKSVALDTVRMKFEPGKWYTMTVEVCGPEIAAHVNGHVAFGQADRIACEKALFRFPVAGEFMAFDNIRVSEATPNPNWPAIKAKLRASAPK
jgi:hypothetical protein